jgi:hypothetical protein
MRSGYLNVANTCSLKIGTGMYSGASEAQANWANVSRWISVWRVGYAWCGNRRLS